MNLSLLFRRCPDTWGCRADPFLWNEMKWSFLDMPLPNSKELFVETIKNKFERLAAQKMDSGKTIYLERFDKGGMSSGQVSTRFWRDEAIPFLLDTACRLGLSWGERSEQCALYHDGIILEEGSAKDPLANSFQDVDTLRWCAAQTDRNLDHLTDDQCANLLFEAVDELDRLDSLFKGERTNAMQALSWPRAGVIGLDLDGECERNDSIPRVLRYGQIALACEYAYPKKVRTKSSEHNHTTRFELHTGSKALEPGFVPAFSPSQALIAPLLEQRRISIVK